MWKVAITEPARKPTSVTASGARPEPRWNSVPEPQPPPSCMPMAKMKAPTRTETLAGASAPPASTPSPRPVASTGANSTVAIASIRSWARSPRPSPVVTSARYAAVNPNAEWWRAMPHPAPTRKSAPWRGPYAAPRAMAPLHRSAPAAVTTFHCTVSARGAAVTARGTSTPGVAGTLRTPSPLGDRDGDPMRGGGGTGAAVSPGAIRSLRLFLVELDKSEDVLPDEPPDRPGAVLRDGDGLVRLDHEAGGLQEAAPLLVERPERGGGLLEREPIAHRKRERVLAHRLLSLLEGIGGGGHDGDALFPELVLRALEGSQLLLAVGSPVGAIEEEDAPALTEVIGHGQASVGHRVHREGGESFAAVQDLGTGSCHEGVLSRFRREASGGMSPAASRWNSDGSPARSWMIGDGPFGMPAHLG